MNRRRWFAAAALGVLATAGLATATPAPVPQADPIGDVIANQPAPVQQPGPVVIAPIQPTGAGDLITETPAVRLDDEPTQVVDADETPRGRPLPELADPLPRSRLAFVVVQALDKVTAETIRFAVPVGQQRRWQGLVFRARACETTAADEPMRDSMAYLEIYAQPRSREGAVEPREIFQGWMYASAPGLNPVEHPLYDAWVISCQAEDPSAA
jgi:hypothetical protein